MSSRKFLGTLLVLYVAALMTSMAGMEIFGWLSALSAIVLISISPSVRNEIQIRPPFDWALWGFFLIVVAGVFANGLWGQNGIHIIGNVRWILLFFFLYWALQIVVSERPEKCERVVRFLIFWACFAGIYGVVQHFTGIDVVRSGKRLLEHSSFYPSSNVRFWRTKGPFSMPLTYAYSYGMFAAILLGLFLSGYLREKKMRWVLLFGILSVYLSILTTYARGGWLAAAVSVGCLLYLGMERKKFWKTAGAVAIGSALLIGSNTTLRARFVSYFNPQFKSNSERWDLWRANFEIFKDHPFFGVGHGRSSTVVAKYFEKLGVEDGFVSHAHNNYLHVLSGTGFLGFFFYIVFMGGFLILTYRLWRRIPSDRVFLKGLTLGALGAQISLHIGGLTENNFFDAEVNHKNIFILALVAVIYRCVLPVKKQNV